MERLNLKNLRVLTAATTLAMFAGTASADLELYGHLNRAMLHVDDGFESAPHFVDNPHSESRLGVKSHMHVNNCMEFGGVAELQFNANNTYDISQHVHTDDPEVAQVRNQVTIRHLDVYWMHVDFGKFSLGRGDAVTNKITEKSYSGMGDTVLHSRVADYAAGFTFHPDGSTARAPFRNSTTVATDVTVATTFDNFDGAGRQHDRVAWMSPEWNGFTVGVSHGHTNPGSDALNRSTQTFSDVAVNYEGEWDDFKFMAGVGYERRTKDTNVVASDTPKTLGGSLAIQHNPTEFNVAVAYSKREFLANARDDGKMYYVQLGKHFDWLKYGKSHVGVDYFKGEDTRVNNDESKSYGVGFVQDFDRANTQAYVGYRHYDYERPGTTYDNMWAVMMGVKFSFGAML